MLIPVEGLAGGFLKIVSVFGSGKTDYFEWEGTKTPHTHALYALG